MKGMTTLFAGATATNVCLLFFGFAFAVIAFLSQQQAVSASLMVSFGGSLVVAGFLGLVNTHILSREVSRITKQPFEDLALLSQIRGSGLEGIFRKRDATLQRLDDAMQSERREIVIVGSSLKGMLGIGLDSDNVGRDLRIRETIRSALNRGTHVHILLTHPAVAHHRSVQEGRREGDIEIEIIRNLVYLAALRKELGTAGERLVVKLYSGAPTIFLVATADLMVINPYPYYSTAYGSFSFLLKGESDLYSGYYTSHYQRAWNDDRLCTTLDSDIGQAKNQIEEYIAGKNRHGEDIVPDESKKNWLRGELNKI